MWVRSLRLSNLCLEWAFTWSSYLLWLQLCGFKLGCWRSPEPCTFDVSAGPVGLWGSGNFRGQRRCLKLHCLNLQRLWLENILVRSNIRLAHEFWLDHDCLTFNKTSFRLKIWRFIKGYSRKCFITQDVNRVLFRPLRCSKGVSCTISEVKHFKDVLLQRILGLKLVRLCCSGRMDWTMFGHIHVVNERFFISCWHWVDDVVVIRVFKLFAEHILMKSFNSLFISVAKKLLNCRHFHLAGHWVRLDRRFAPKLSWL